MSKLYDGEYKVKFVRKTGGGNFFFLLAEDVASVNVKDMKVLTHLKYICILFVI